MTLQNSHVWYGKGNNVGENWAGVLGWSFCETVFCLCFALLDLLSFTMVIFLCQCFCDYPIPCQSTLSHLHVCIFPAFFIAVQLFYTLTFLCTAVSGVLVLMLMLCIDEDRETCFLRAIAVLMALSGG